MSFSYSLDKLQSLKNNIFFKEQAKSRGISEAEAHF